MQKKSISTKILSLVLCLILTVSMAFGLAGCGNSDAPVVSGTQLTQVYEEGVIGEGDTEFALIVADADGNETNFTVRTDETTVGAALLENKVIAGDEGDYGLYVKEVNGIVADYDVDQTYWAFYIDGEYAMTGVDATDITAGATYMLKVEK